MSAAGGSIFPSGAFRVAYIAPIRAGAYSSAHIFVMCPTPIIMKKYVDSP